ncbi:MAG: iron chelate uptake ABC transporter family permease subunit, partial [Pseudomonadota bacterium]
MAIVSSIPMSPDSQRLGRHEGDRSGIARFVIILLAAALFMTGTFSIASGALDLSASSVVWAMVTGNADSVSSVDRIVIMDIRLPRTLLGILIGASLAVSGAIMQGLFRNPLADPGIVGVTAGASLGAVTFIVLGSTVLSPVAAIMGIYQVPFAAFLGGLV